MVCASKSHLKNIALCPPSRKRRHLKRYHLSSYVACDPPSRSLAQTAVDLRSQVQEREGAGSESAGKITDCT